MDSFEDMIDKALSVLNTPVLRIKAKADAESEKHASDRAFEVYEAVVVKSFGRDGARRAIAVTRLAYERLLRVTDLEGRRAWGFPVCTNEVEALARAEELFGVGHPEAERELARLDALPCEPYADEVARGLFEALRRIVDPLHVALCGFSFDQGWDL